VSRCRRTLLGEGHSAASWGIGKLSTCRLQVQSPFVQAVGAR